MNANGRIYGPACSAFSVQSTARPIIEVLFADQAFGDGAAITDVAVFFGARQFLRRAEAFQNQFAGRNDRAVGVLFDLAAADGIDQAVHALEFLDGFFVGDHVADRQRASVVEVV